MGIIINHKKDPYQPTSIMQCEQGFVAVAQVGYVNSLEGISGGSWMYPYQRTPMGNPDISPITRGYLWVIIPKREVYFRIGSTFKLK